MLGVTRLGQKLGTNTCIKSAKLIIRGPPEVDTLPMIMLPVQNPATDRGQPVAFIEESLGCVHCFRPTLMEDSGEAKSLGLVPFAFNMSDLRLRGKYRQVRGGRYVHITCHENSFT